MSDSNCIWVIDDAPIDSSWIQYFSALNLSVVQTSITNLIPPTKKAIAAILLSSNHIKGNLSFIDLLCHYHKPIIIIGETGGDKDFCIRALEAGADDFLMKPILPRELIIRISTISRRIDQQIPVIDPPKEVLLFEGWRLLPKSRQLFDSFNKEHLLSNIAFDLLLAFLRHPQQILDRHFLLTIAHVTPRNGMDRRIDLHISRLRQKLETSNNKPLIKAIRYKGYLFTATVTTEYS